MHIADLAGALRRDLTSAQLPANRRTRARLRKRTWRYADASIVAGMSLERTIMQMKRIAHDTGRAPADVDGLIVDLVGWCVERYFTITARAVIRRRDARAKMWIREPA